MRAPPLTENAGSTTYERELLARFESIGDTCEFGFVQRHAGIETLSLLRWVVLSNVELFHGDGRANLRMLVKALAEGFACLDDPESILVREPMRQMSYEFSFHVPRYDMTGHTNRYEYTSDLESVRREYVNALPVMRDIFLSNLSQGSKILVYRSLANLDRADLNELLQALNAYGQNKLLFVTQDKSLSSPRVEGLDSNLVTAFVPKLTAFGEADKYVYPFWLHVCDESVRLFS